MINDLMSDMLVRINNGYMNKLTKVVVLNSKFCWRVLFLLYYEGFIYGFYLTKEGTIIVKLKYTLNKNIFKNYKRISKPGSRVYATAVELYRNYSEKSFIVVSTTKGLVSHRYAISKNLGGEVLFELSYF